MRITLPSNTDFTLRNLPFGIARTSDDRTSVVSRIGDHIIHLGTLADNGHFDSVGLEKETLHREVMNDFIAQGKSVTNGVRKAVRTWLEGDDDSLDAMALMPLDAVEMLMPVHVGDYTDFYSSKEHATNVGSMFRDPDNALLPNWLHLPVGYHGRASSIVVSGTPIHRPKGQMKPNADEPPVFGPCRLLDFELEMGFVVGKDTELGEAIPVEKAEDYIFGLLLFNDWSARDIQKWEYVPLGPFLGKNFASSVAPWIVPLEALDSLRRDKPAQDPEPLPYLQQSGKHNFDIDLEVEIVPSEGEGKVVCRSNFKYMYWSMAQQLAHHTVNGCNVRVGDICASGTISGPTPDSYGSMLEISWRGTKPVDMPDGSQRKFLQDGDTVVMRGFGGEGDERVGFGEVRSKILPAK